MFYVLLAAAAVVGFCFWFNLTKLLPKVRKLNADCEADAQRFHDPKFLTFKMPEWPVKALIVWTGLFFVADLFVAVRYL